MLILFLLQMSDVKKYGALNGEKHVKSDLNHVSKSDLNPIWNLNLFLQKLDFMSNTPPLPLPAPFWLQKWFPEQIKYSDLNYMSEQSKRKWLA